VVAAPDDAPAIAGHARRGLPPPSPLRVWPSMIVGPLAHASGLEAACWLCGCTAIVRGKPAPAYRGDSHGVLPALFGRPKDSFRIVLLTRYFGNPPRFVQPPKPLSSRRHVRR